MGIEGVAGSNRLEAKREEHDALEDGSEGVTKALNTLAGYERIKTPAEARDALARFQTSAGLPPTGRADARTVDALSRAAAHVVSLSVEGHEAPAAPPTGALQRFAHEAQVYAHHELQNVGRRHMDSSAGATSDYPNRAAASAAFAKQAATLADVSKWDALSGKENANFSLFDASGKPAAGRNAAAGDFVRVRLPGQSTYDWVRVEDVSISPERVAIRVRPTYDPTQQPVNPAVIAHFFDRGTTNTFSVALEGNSVEARVEGRNESPNTGGTAGDTAKAARNLAACEGAWGPRVHVPGIASTELNGLQQHQWNVFTKNLSEVR